MVVFILMYILRGMFILKCVSVTFTLNRARGRMALFFAIVNVEDHVCYFPENHLNQGSQTQNNRRFASSTLHSSPSSGKLTHPPVFTPVYSRFVTK